MYVTSAGGAMARIVAMRGVGKQLLGEQPLLNEWRPTLQPMRGFLRDPRGVPDAGSR